MMNQPPAASNLGGAFAKTKCLCADYWLCVWQFGALRTGVSDTLKKKYKFAFHIQNNFIEMSFYVVKA